jgi:hypothetical protein
MIQTIKKSGGRMQNKEEDLLKELCAGDAQLHAVLGSILYLDPVAATRAHASKNLELLLEEAETNIKEGNLEAAIRKYRECVERTIFEAAQNPEERGRYIKAIQSLLSKNIRATEKAREQAEKKGLTERAASFGKDIERYEFMRKRIDDVTNVAAHFYNEKLAMSADVQRREARQEEIRSLQTEATREARGEGARREARREARKKMGREARREAEKEEKKIEKGEEAQRAIRREKIRDLEREERQEAWGDKDRRRARRKKMRDARQKELE